MHDCNGAVRVRRTHFRRIPEVHAEACVRKKRRSPLQWNPVTRAARPRTGPPVVFADRLRRPYRDRHGAGPGKMRLSSRPESCGTRFMRNRMVILSTTVLLVVPVASTLAAPGGRAERRFPERGSSATMYGGSSADRYGGTSADRGGVAGPRDSRTYGRPNTKERENNAPRHKEDDQAQDQEEE